MSRFSVALPGEPTELGHVEFFQAPTEFQAKKQKLTAPELLGRVKALEPGTFLLVKKAFADMGEEKATAQFIDEEAFGAGRQEQSHGVRFGQILLSSASDRELTEFAALKPFDLAKNAMHEYGAMHVLNSFGKKNRPHLAFNPLGFYRVPGTGETAVVSEYDESVISYDNLFWNTEQSPTKPELHKALARCGFALGFLHAKGFVHGDPQAKNLARDQKGVRFVDLEDAGPFPGKNGEVDPLGTRYAIEHDLRRFIFSLGARHEEEPDYSEEIRDVFAPNYARTAGLPTSRVPYDAQLSIQDVIDLSQE